MRDIHKNFWLLAISLMAAAAVTELGVRVAHRQFSLESFLGEQRNFLKSAYPAEFDARLGWVPKIGPSGRENTWGTIVTIVDRNVRSNGPASLEAGERPVLAVGDSFTFGDQVSDHETWPASLEELLGRAVINGGVFGYGIDQSYLRAIELMERYRPGVLIFSFVPDDISRCELSTRYGLAKPYFRVHDGSLELENVPVPAPTHTTVAGRFREVLGYSYLAHVVMMRAAPDFWLRGNRWESERVHTQGLAVSCRLLARLVDAADGFGVEQVIVLVQYGERTRSHDYPMVDRVLSCMNRSSAVVVDLRERLRDARADGTFDSLFDAHMTAAGNAFVARVLAPAIVDSGRE